MHIDTHKRDRGMFGLCGIQKKNVRISKFLFASFDKQKSHCSRSKIEKAHTHTHTFYVDK